MCNAGVVHGNLDIGNFVFNKEVCWMGVFFRGCRRQPLYCFQIDIFIWLHVTDIYIYIYIYIIRQPTVVREW